VGTLKYAYSLKSGCALPDSGHPGEVICKKAVADPAVNQESILAYDQRQGAIQHMTRTELSEDMTGSTITSVYIKKYQFLRFSQGQIKGDFGGRVTLS
jgi:hypothetical protein